MLWGREKSCPCQESNPGLSAHSLSLYRLNYPGSLHNIKHNEKIEITTNLLQTAMLWGKMDTNEKFIFNI
jgi:hypothetical protein